MVGFEEALVAAHELSCVQDESPLATVMIYRLLLAVLHRVVDGPALLPAWEKIWCEPRFDEDRVRGYFEQWRHRFDLFDLERPFLQVPRLAGVLRNERPGKEPEAIPVRRLALECSWYAGSVNLLEHGGDEQGLTPAEAVRAMLGFLGFGPGGRILNDSGYPKACPLRGGALVLARGATLRETLTLNLLTPGSRRMPAEVGDLPAWEQSGPADRRKRAVRGWLDALTWQARRVELVPLDGPNGPRVVQSVTGVGLEPEGDWFEPMHAVVVRDPARGPESVRFEPDRAAWRDALALFQGTGAMENYRGPSVCTQIGKLVEEDVLPREMLFKLELYGLASSQAAIGLWRAERMPLPVALLVDGDRLLAIGRGLEQAKQVGDALRASTWLLARLALSMGERAPDKKDVGGLVDRLDSTGRYWAALGSGFGSFLEAVGREAPEPAVASWVHAAQAEARRALDRAAAQVGSTARAFQ
ncbi:MAG: type I-E CRISPR-associated protein Cse1/CasA, partial [Polyangiaceae bacterium]